MKTVFKIFIFIIIVFALIFVGIVMFLAHASKIGSDEVAFNNVVVEDDSIQISAMITNSSKHFVKFSYQIEDDTIVIDMYCRYMSTKQSGNPNINIPIDTANIKNITFRGKEKADLKIIWKSQTSSKGKSEQENSSDSTRKIESVDFGSYSFDGEAIFNDDIIKSADIAKQYADIVFSDTLGKDLKRFEVVTISFDSKNNIWVVNYAINKETLGGDVSIAISKKTGEIKKIWFGE